MVRWLWLASTLVACVAPRVLVETSDAGDASTKTDVATDTRPACRGFILDGGACTGHDDDGDCVPDSCDSCPSVANAPAPSVVVLESGIDTIPDTAICAHPFPPFDVVRKRLYFEPFEDASHPFSVHSTTAMSGLFRRTSEVKLGGSSTDGTGWPWVAFPAVSVPTGKSLSIIAVMRIENGGGLLARLSEGGMFDTYYAFGCYVSVLGRRFGAFKAAPPCNTGGCDVSNAKTPLPDFIPDSGRVGVRMSVADVAEGTLVECELFDPENPQSLLFARSSAPVSSTTFPTVYSYGGVGFFTEQAPTVLESFEVQSAP